jgi:TonB family protein
MFAFFMKLKPTKSSIRLLLLATLALPLGACNDLFEDFQLPPTESNLSAHEGSKPDSTLHCIFVAEEQASFPDGSKAWNNYLRKNISYPSQATIEGKVALSFTVLASGKISDIAVIRGTNPVMDDLAIKLLANSPTWLPAKEHGHKVNSRMAVLIQFGNLV